MHLRVYALLVCVSTDYVNTYGDLVLWRPGNTGFNEITRNNKAFRDRHLINWDLVILDDINDYYCNKM